MYVYVCIHYLQRSFLLQRFFLDIMYISSKWSTREIDATEWENLVSIKFCKVPPRWHWRSLNLAIYYATCSHTCTIGSYYWQKKIRQIAKLKPLPKLPAVQTLFSKSSLIKSFTTQHTHTSAGFCPHWSAVVTLNHHSAFFHHHWSILTTTRHNRVQGRKCYTKITLWLTHSYSLRSQHPEQSGQSSENGPVPLHIGMTNLLTESKRTHTVYKLSANPNT